MNPSSVPETTPVLELSPAERFEQDVARLAASEHDLWRFARTTHEDGTVMPEGMYVPRPKPTDDKEWIARHNGIAIVDIANTAYQDLPSDWQEENKVSATIALTFAYRQTFYGEGNYVDADFLHFASKQRLAGHRLHDEWLFRHADYATEEQLLPFVQLSAAEQEKDLRFYEGAANIVNERRTDGIFEVPEDMIAEWLMWDVHHLTHASRTGAYTQEGTHDDSPWAVNVEKLYVAYADRLRLKMTIGNSAVQLDGIYPLAETARFMANLRLNAPDPHELMINRKVILSQRRRADIRAQKATSIHDF